MVEVEVDVSSGMPKFVIVGLGDTAVNESRDRVRSAIKNNGLEFAAKRITINLAPANIRKEGCAFDLPIGIGILAATAQLPIKNLSDYALVGELSLSGEIKPVKGILAMAMKLSKYGIKNFFVPNKNSDEAAVVKGINILPVNNITEVIRHIKGERIINPYVVEIDKVFNRNVTYDVDFADVKGQESVKRALEVAASGSHNCLMVGSPGSGKTMIARTLPTILPHLGFEESLEVTKIYSSAGLIPEDTSLIVTRPFRTPHHSISAASLIGGGRIPKPGEMSLAHYGVLFLDELTEFPSNVLEVMRQPLEDGQVTISRVNATITYPSKTMIVCAANPCKCGYYGDSIRECTCTPTQISNYLSKLSGPMLDRIDIQVQVKGIKYTDINDSRKSEYSQVIKQRVTKARKIQHERYKAEGIYTNSQLKAHMLDKYCRLEKEGKQLLESVFEKLGLAARAYSRILKVARTIADMDESEGIKIRHIAEAIQYRSLDRNIVG